jgi:cation:H+ antiporter
MKMLTLNILSLLPIAPLLFLISLLIVMVTSAWFTRRLEALCEAFGLSIGILSLLSAIGANIPNYAASAVAIIGGHTYVGIGIIVGSSIYNIAIILGLCTLTSREAPGITLNAQESQDARGIAWYALAIVLSILVVIALLPATAAIAEPRQVSPMHFLVPIASVIVLGIFSALIVHILRRSHPAPASPLATHSHTHLSRSPSVRVFRLIGEVVLSLVVALMGVLVMVQSGQTVSTDVHLPQALTGLVVLAVATSLPNTVVAVSLARTGEAAASVEEIFSSNSINAALGLALPLLFWQGVLHDRSILFLDMPLTILLTLGMLVGVFRRRMSRAFGLVLLCIYVAWVMVHLWI